MLPSLNFHCFELLFAPLAGCFTWIPVVAILTMGFGVWHKSDRARYSLGRRWALITPSIVIGEIMFLTAWHQQHLYDTTATNKVTLLFFALFPLTAILVARLRHCWLFASLICLAQIWLGFAVMAAAIIYEAPALRMN